jgi:hypothetical protein
MFGFLGNLFNRDAMDRAARANYNTRDEYLGLNPNIAAQEARGAAYDRLASMGAQGGMDAGSKAALQQAQANNAQQAQSKNKATLERAAAAGRLNGGRALSAEMQANQGAANANAMAGTQAAADARQRAMMATTAQGQIDQFNAQMRQGAQQNSFNNSFNRAQGIAQANGRITDMNLGRANQAREDANGFTQGLMRGGAGLAGAFLADGGLIEGEAKVPGDSIANDTVPAKLSPGEMVIPRSVVTQGPEAVRAFARKLLLDEE